mgnify:CR=1 FL=1
MGPPPAAGPARRCRTYAYNASGPPPTMSCHVVVGASHTMVVRNAGVASAGSGDAVARAREPRADAFRNGLFWRARPAAMGKMWPSVVNTNRSPHVLTGWSKSNSSVRYLVVSARKKDCIRSRSAFDDTSSTSAKPHWVRQWVFSDSTASAPSSNQNESCVA